MPFAQHIRMTMIGTVGPASGGGTRVEAFSYGINLSDPATAEDPVDNESQAIDLANDAKAFHGRPTSWMSDQCVLQLVKFARIGADGKYLQEPRVVEVLQPGGGGALKYPLQVALAVSLNTARRGASGRGRFYLPCPTVPFGTAQGQFDSAQVLAVAQSVATFLTAVNDQPGLEGIAPKVTVASSLGFNSDVTSVRVGSVPDTIRSRRRQLLEAYSANQAVV